MDLSEKQHHTKKCNEIRRLNLKLASMPTTQLHLLDEIQHNKPIFCTNTTAHFDEFTHLTLVLAAQRIEPLLMLVFYFHTF